MLTALLALAAFLSAAAQPQQPPADAVRTVAIRLADGRVLRCSTDAQPRGSGWTPIVPTIAGAATSRDGLELTALDHTCGRQAGDLIVTIALWYGSPHQRRIPVATIVPREGASIRVRELRAFGVQPVEISIETLPAPVLHVPVIDSSSPRVQVTAAVEGPPSPGYLFSVLNTNAQPVMEVKFDTYRGAAVATSGGAHHVDGTPLIEPGGTYTIRQPVSVDSRTGQWLPTDRFRITLVKWADGSEEHAPSSRRTPATADTRSRRGGNGMISPTVFASWITERGNDSERLRLLVLWRGTPGWFFVGGGRIGSSSSGARTHATIEYGDIRLALDYGGDNTATINGRDVQLGTDNVVYVDDVDAAGGGRVVRTARIPSQMPGSAGQIGLAIRDVPDIVTYLQCDARAADAMRQRLIETTAACMVNLGR